MHQKIRNLCEPPPRGDLQPRPFRVPSGRSFRASTKHLYRRRRSVAAAADCGATKAIDYTQLAWLIGWRLTALLAQYGDIVCLDYTQRIEPQRVQVARSHHDLAVDLKGREVGSGWSRGVQAPNVATVYGYLPQQKGRKPPPHWNFFTTGLHCSALPHIAWFRKPKGSNAGIKKGVSRAEIPLPSRKDDSLPHRIFSRLDCG